MTDPKPRESSEPRRWTLWRSNLGNGRWSGWELWGPPVVLGDEERVEVMPVSEHELFRFEQRTLRLRAHALIQTIRGLCTDEADHREIDAKLVELDDLVHLGQKAPRGR